MTSHVQDLDAARAGDWLEVKGVSDSPSRRGEIVQVLGTPGHPHFRVRWDEGHESIVYPSDHGAIVHHLLEAFATSAASAVATAQSVTSERHRQRLAAAEGERSRWARELHDETLQGLNALRLGLAAAGRTEQSPTAKPVFAESVEQLEETIATLRALITDLRPAALDALGVKAAIETLAERNAHEELEIDISVELAYEQRLKPTRLMDELETALYRITQEALTNATKHRQATRIVIEIHEDSTTVHLSVRDDGHGFDPDAQSGGFGLLGIRERTELLNGELQVSSTPEKGTTLRVRLPVRRRAEESTRLTRPGQFSAEAQRRQRQHS